MANVDEPVNFNINEVAAKLAKFVPPMVVAFKTYGLQLLAAAYFNGPWGAGYCGAGNVDEWIVVTVFIVFCLFAGVLMMECEVYRDHAGRLVRMSGIQQVALIFRILLLHLWIIFVDVEPLTCWLPITPHGGSEYETSLKFISLNRTLILLGGTLLYALLTIGVEQWKFLDAENIRGELADEQLVLRKTIVIIVVFDVIHARCNRRANRHNNDQLQNVNGQVHVQEPDDDIRRVANNHEADDDVKIPLLA